MLKSNSKQFKNKVQTYILDCIEVENINNPTIQEKLQYVADCFEIEKYRPYAEQYKKLWNITVNKQALFIDWMQGLPSSFNVDFTYNDRRNILKHWFEESDEQAAKYHDMILDTLFLKMIYNNFVILCKQNNIKF